MTGFSVLKTTGFRVIEEGTLRSEKIGEAAIRWH
jgi:hypothetical protein